jgi:hypothetical protein
VVRNERPTQHRSRPDWPARLALTAAITVWVAGGVAARALLAPRLIDWASRLSHASPAWMFTAGWATAAFAPATLLIFMLDSHRRERDLGDDPRTRPRAAHGHAVPGRGAGYWLRRTPLILPFLLVVAFVPTRGGGPVVWHDTPGAVSFGHGWYLSFLISLPAVLALLIFRLLAWAPGSRARLLRLAGPWVAAAPALALLALPASPH